MNDKETNSYIYIYISEDANNSFERLFSNNYNDICNKGLKDGCKIAYMMGIRHAMEHLKLDCQLIIEEIDRHML